MNRALIEKQSKLDFFGDEAVNTICSNLYFAGKNIQKVLISSFSASEGKSFTARQILWNLSQRGKRAVLIDADLRRSTMVRDIGFKTTGAIQGLAQYLAGYCRLEDALYETNIAHAVIMPIGRSIKNPIALLTLPEFPELLDILAERYDIVLIDSPPVGVVIDAAEIAKHCDGALLVVEYDKTRRRNLLQARNLIEQTGCPIFGCIINKIKLDSFGAKRYYNYYGHYGSYTSK